MSHYVTSHDANGQAVFSDKVPAQRKGLNTPMGGMSFLYTTYSALADVSNEDDVEKYHHDRENGIPMGK